MESSRFDQLARLFGARRTRRAAIPLLGGTLALPIMAVDDVDARKRRRKKKKKKKSCANKC